MRENISPEEKLLRLIKGEKKQPAPNLLPRDTALDKKTTPHASDLKLSAKNAINFFIQTYLNQANIVKIIPLLLAVSVIYLVATFIYPWVGLRKIKLPTVSRERITEPVVLPGEEAKPYEFYLEGARGRQIFKSPTVQESTVTSIAAEAQSIKDINLIGIISGENPQAIIEDKKTQKTYYVSKGQFIGEFQVEDIQEGKIILNYKGQKYELSL